MVFAQFEKSASCVHMRHQTPSYPFVFQSGFLSTKQGVHWHHAAEFRGSCSHNAVIICNKLYPHDFIILDVDPQRLQLICWFVLSCPRVASIFFIFIEWLIAYSAPSHYLTVCRWWPFCTGGDELWLKPIIWPSFFACIFKFIFVNANCCLLLQMSLQFFPKSPVNTKPSLV